MADGSGVALGGIVHINASLPKNASVPMQHIAYGSPAKIVAPDHAPAVAKQLDFYANVFNIEDDEHARGKAARAYAQFLRKQHAQDGVLDAHANKAPARRALGDEPPATQSANVEGVMDAMMLELKEMELRRQEALKKKPRG